MGTTTRAAPRVPARGPGPRVRAAPRGVSRASGRLPAMSSAPRASAIAPADVEAWLTELGLEPLERADREGVTSWDLVLDGRRRAALRVTLILDPIARAHLLGPLRPADQRFLPQVVPGAAALERRAAVREVLDRGRRAAAARRGAARGAALDRDALGIALARELAVADRFLDETVDWLKGGGWPPTPVAAGAEGPGTRLLARYAASLAELLDAPLDAPVDAAPSVDAEVPA